MASEAKGTPEQHTPGKIAPIDFTKLVLDPENPRLPERLHGATPSEIVRFLYDNAVLRELAESFLDNGYFQHEPLVVLKVNRAGKHVVLEGNRRLAALLILCQRPEAGDLRFVDLEPTEDQLARLRRIPCYVIDEREDVHRFLGFRHIGGIKTWPPEAKARYLLGEIDRAHGDGEEDPFYIVGRRVGSNAQGVRNPYVAIKILRYARDQHGLDVQDVQQDRFGVWQRCMNSPEIRGYIGFDGAQTYPEVQERLASIDADKLKEVLSDLTPPDARRKAILWDSRLVTEYGRVLAHDKARTALRKYRDLNIARQVVDQAALPERLARLVDTIKVLLEEVHQANVGEELVRAAEELFGVARTLRDTVKSRLAEHE